MSRRTWTRQVDLGEKYLIDRATDFILSVSGEEAGSRSDIGTQVAKDWYMPPPFAPCRIDHIRGAEQKKEYIERWLREQYYKIAIDSAKRSEWSRYDPHDIVNREEYLRE